MGAIIPGVTKIAVLRANALGDFIFSLPAIQSIKDAYKQAEVVYLGLPWHKEFLQNRPGPIDRVIQIPKYNGLPGEHDKIENVMEVNRFFKEMKEEKFDIAFQMHGGGRHSNPFLKELGAKITVGFHTPDAMLLDISIPYSVYHNEILRYIELATCAGAVCKQLSPSLECTSSDWTELRKILSPVKPYAVIHPGASSIRRRWPPEKFAEVADSLAEKGITIYITGSSAEHVLATEMAELMKHTPHITVGKLSIGALTALISGSCLLISNDTGPLHLARALKVPTVGIYLAVNMIMACPVTALTNRTCISWRSHCPLCKKSFNEDDFNNPAGDCSHAASFVADIPVEEVTEKAFELVQM